MGSLLTHKPHNYLEWVLLPQLLYCLLGRFPSPLAREGLCRGQEHQPGQLPPGLLPRPRKTPRTSVECQGHRQHLFIRLLIPTSAADTPHRPFLSLPKNRKQKKANLIHCPRLLNRELRAEAVFER